CALSACMALTMSSLSFAAGETSSSVPDENPSPAELLEGAEYAEDQLLVMFDDSKSNRTIKKVVDKYDGEVENIVKDDENKTAKINIADDKSIERAILELQSDKNVEFV
ncbi:MAG: hypothetical protein Q4B78_01885, partial [Bacillota bacterium]|nr:hypothetical protein [Bacillota bacterium]